MMTTRFDAEAIVRGFIGAFRDCWPDDLDVALAPLADDASYQIVVPSIAPIEGREAIQRELLRMREKVAGQRHTMKAVAASGNTVFTERVDESLRNGQWVAIPLVAVFELNDRGQILRWRGYLDLGDVSRRHGMTVEALHASLAHS